MFDQVGQRAFVDDLRCQDVALQISLQGAVFDQDFRDVCRHVVNFAI